MQIKARVTTTGHYVLDDGATVLSACPCCSKPLSSEAAQRLINMAEQSGVPLNQLDNLLAPPFPQETH